MIKDFMFKKKFGQNFINDENIINKIISLADIKEESLIIEIGAGSGVLTKKLIASNQQVLAYEIDETLKPYLEKIEDSNLKIIYDDFLKRDIKKDIADFNYKQINVVANLPYYITTPIIEKIIDSNINVFKMIIMVQKEVGERFAANPGQKEYNSLTIFLNYYFDIKKLMSVSKNVFYPKPQVDSVVVQFTKKSDSFNVKNEKIFFKLIRDAFRYKRKTLKNNLSGYNLALISNILEKYALNLNVRAEQLPIEVFVDIANNILERE